MDKKEYIIIGVELVLYLVFGWKIIKDAFRGVRNGFLFDENFLMTIASLASIAIGEYSEAVMVMALFRIGEFLQDKAVDSSRRAITDLIDIRTDYANLETTAAKVTEAELAKAFGETERVNPETLVPGDLIVIQPGDRIPVDGVVVFGSSRLDTAALTGESMPTDVSAGSEVYSGSINLDGLIRVRVSKRADESTAARILELVENSAVNRAKAENFITKFSQVYTPVVCGIAVAIAIIPSLITGDWASWVRRAVIMLVVSCPCALVISIPLGFFGGIGGASKRGILIKGGNYLEALANADTVICDKTGTLTKGVFKVVAVHPQIMEADKVLEYAAYAENFSNHPIARSLADEYGKHIDKSKITDVHETAGAGISALVDGVEVCCGNDKMMELKKVHVGECNISGTMIHVLVEGVYVGHIVISDQLKEDSPAALAELKRLGVKRTVMVTGDREEIASAVAKQLPDLDEYHAKALPEDKVRITMDVIEAYEAKLPSAEGRKKNERKERVAFIGDGINDAPVLAVADVGIAMGGMGTAAAVEAADIVLMNDRPSDIALAVRIARKTMKVVKENIWFSIGVKLTVLILSAFGLSTIWLAEFADVGVCLLAILNSMRCLKID